MAGGGWLRPPGGEGWSAAGRKETRQLTPSDVERVKESRVMRSEFGTPLLLWGRKAQVRSSPLYVRTYVCMYDYVAAYKAGSTARAPSVFKQSHVATWISTGAGRVSYV